MFISFVKADKYATEVLQSRPLYTLTVVFLVHVLELLISISFYSISYPKILKYSQLIYLQVILHLSYIIVFKRFLDSKIDLLYLILFNYFCFVFGLSVYIN